MSGRFDISYHQRGCSIDYHFCREWDDEGGCYGTRPDHGFSWEEAKQAMVDYHLTQAQRWRKMTLRKWKRGDSP